MAPPSLNSDIASLIRDAAHHLPRGLGFPISLHLPRSAPPELELDGKAVEQMSPEERCKLYQKAMQELSRTRFTKSFRGSSSYFEIPAAITAQLVKDLEEAKKKLEPPRLVFKDTTFLEDPAFTFSFGAILEKGTEVLLRECNDPTNAPAIWDEPGVGGILVDSGYCVFRVPSVHAGPARTVIMPVKEVPEYFEGVGGGLDTGISADLMTVPGLLVGTGQKISTHEEFMTAPRKELAHEKRMFKARLRKELALFEKIHRAQERAEGFYASDLAIFADLEERMRQMLVLVDQVPFLEVDAGTVNDIPAFFIPDPEKKTGVILFAKGSFNFSLALHEMGHADQFMGDPEINYIDLGLGGEVTTKLDATTPEEQLIRESYVYNMNVAYFLFKIGYGADQIDEISQALSGRLLDALDFLEGSNDQNPDLCRVMGGKLPKIYELVKKLSDKINTLPDFNAAEKSSAIALTLAYLHIRIDSYGYIHEDRKAYRNLLEKFYQKHFEAEAAN